jgi:hypothetical protein
MIMFAKRIHSSLAFCEFVRRFANSRGCAKNENPSPGPLMFRNIKIVEGAEGKKKQLPSQCLWKEKKKIKKTLTHCVGGGPQLFADFHFSREVLEHNPCDKRGMSVWWEHCLLLPRLDSYRAVLYQFVLLQCHLFSTCSHKIVRWAMYRPV